jgi:hypothetical protein
MIDLAESLKGDEFGRAECQRNGIDRLTGVGDDPRGAFGGKLVPDKLGQRL